MRHIFTGAIVLAFALSACAAQPMPTPQVVTVEIPGPQPTPQIIEKTVKIPVTTIPSACLDALKAGDQAFDALSEWLDAMAESDFDKADETSDTMAEFYDDYLDAEVLCREGATTSY